MVLERPRMDRMQPSYGPPNRDDDNVFFGARSRSDAGSRRWRLRGGTFIRRAVRSSLALLDATAKTERLQRNIMIRK